MKKLDLFQFLNGGNMSYKYYTILTDVGKQKLAEAIATESPLDFTEMAVGDSNGTSYDPTSDMTALKHEVYRAAISSMKINTDDANIMEFEFVVPSTSGGYYVREAGLFASDGSLIAISRLPEQYKADMAEGAGSSMTVRILVAISSEAQLYINVPESITYATQAYVAEEFKKHTQEEDPHQQYMLETSANEIFATKESVTTSLDAKADKEHNHDGVYAKIGTVTLSDGSVKSNHIAANAVTANHLTPNSVGESELGYTPAKRTSQMTVTELFTRAGVSGKITTAALVTGIVKNINNFRGITVVGWLRPANISDLPADHLFVTITVGDQNGVFMEARAPFGDNSLWIGSTNKGTWGGWKQVRNTEGQATILEIINETENTWRYCANVGLTAHYASPNATGDIHGQNKLSEPVLILSLGSSLSDRKVQLAIGTDTNSLYVRTARIPNSPGVYQYGAWRKI